MKFLRNFFGLENADQVINNKRAEAVVEDTRKGFVFFASIALVIISLFASQTVNAQKLRPTYNTEVNQNIDAQLAAYSINVAGDYGRKDMGGFRMKGSAYGNTVVVTYAYDTTIPYSPTIESTFKKIMTDLMRPHLAGKGISLKVVVADRFFNETFSFTINSYEF